MLRSHRNTSGNGETVGITIKQTPTSSGYGNVENNILENEGTQTNQKHLLMKHKSLQPDQSETQSLVVIWLRGQSRSPKNSKQWLPWHSWILPSKSCGGVGCRQRNILLGFPKTTPFVGASQGSQTVKNPPARQKTWVLIPGLGRSPGEGNGLPTPVFFLENPMGGGAWGYSTVQFSCSGESDSLRPCGLQHTRPPCPSPTPRIYSNSCPLSR